MCCSSATPHVQHPSAACAHGFKRAHPRRLRCRICARNESGSGRHQHAPAAIGNGILTFMPASRYMPKKGASCSQFMTFFAVCRPDLLYAQEKPADCVSFPQRSSVGDVLYVEDALNPYTPYSPGLPAARVAIPVTHSELRKITAALGRVAAFAVKTCVLRWSQSAYTIQGYMPHSLSFWSWSRLAARTFRCHVPADCLEFFLQRRPSGVSVTNLIQKLQRFVSPAHVSQSTQLPCEVLVYLSA